MKNWKKGLNFERKVVNMRKKIKANEQGAVLLTVLCFTTVILIIAATALKIASYSNQQSNKNLCKTQAQIIAENYLVGYLSTFPVETDSTGNQYVNYDKLKTLAGGNTEETATQVVCTLREEGSNTIINTDEYTAGGTCTIYIYNANGGVVVKSAATYNGETEIASAFFDGKITRPYESNNVIETNGSYNVTDIAAPVWGDVMIENLDTTTVTSFHNSNGYFNSNLYTNSNFYFGQGTTTQYIKDTIYGHAPTITAVGNIFMTNLDMKTDVGKIDQAGKRKADSGYDRNFLLNRDGYINSDSNIILGQGCSIGGYDGTKKDPIDIYCRNLYIGSVSIPTYASNEVKNEMSVVSSAISNAGMSLYQNGVGEFITGNVYVKKGSGSSQKGNVYINQNGNGAIVNGDMFVEGDIYISAGKLTVKGALYVGGNVYGPSGSIITGSSSGNLDCILRVDWNASNTRSVKPRLDYAPGLYEYGVRDDPDISNPSSYRDSTPNNMYKDGTINNVANPDLAKAAKYIQDKFQFALAHGIEDKYTDGSGEHLISNITLSGMPPAQYNAVWLGGGLEVYKSCKLTTAQVGELQGGTAGMMTVKVTNEDIVILLPVSKNTNSNILTRIRVDNSAKTGDYFVYFMFYDPNNGAEATDNFYTRTASANSSTSVTFRPAGNQKSGAMICDTQFCPMNGSTMTNYGNTNIFYMLPDGVTMYVGSSGLHARLQGVVYGPQSFVKFTEPANPGDFSGVYGQIKVESYTVSQNHNIQNIFNCPPANDSILGYIAAKSPSSGNLKFKYYVKHN